MSKRRTAARIVKKSAHIAAPILPIPKKTGNIQTSSVPLYLTLFVTLVVVIAFENRLSHLTFSEPTTSDLSEFDKKELDTFTETNKLLTTLATLLIGATTTLLLNSEQTVRLEKADFRRAVAAWVSAAISLYFGHLNRSTAESDSSGFKY